MSRQFKRMVLLAVALIISASAVAVTKAGGPGKRPPMDPRGEPGGLRKGVTDCYKVWHNDDGWHVHVVNGRGSKDHRYQGTITVENGVVEDIHSKLAKKNGVEAQWKSGPRKNELSWDFATPEKEDGINFRLSKGAVVIRLTLTIDGKEIPDRIFIGKRGDNPETSTFEFAAHPNK
jgi:hypothetical protein